MGVVISEPPVHAKMQIGGNWESGLGRFEVSNPANPSEMVGRRVEVWCSMQSGRCCRESRQPTWAERTFVERAQVLSQGLDRFVSGMEARVPSMRARTDVFLPRRWLNYAACAQKLMLELAAELDAGRQLKAASRRAFVRYLPYTASSFQLCRGMRRLPWRISPRDTWRSPVGRADVPLR